MEPTFYSRISLWRDFLSGGHHSIDLLPLNVFVLITKFKMETVTLVLASIRNREIILS